MSTHTLLVADDSQTVQRIIEMACANTGISVISVSDGERAMTQIAAQPPDLVLADIGMPGRNGYEVAAFVKGRADLAHIPVLLMAGMFESADENRASAIGCAEILVKPLKPHHLLDRVRHWLHHDAATDAQSATTGVAEPQSAPASVSPAPSTPAQAAEDYFTRLDAAFQSLGPLGTRIGEPAGGSRAETTGGMSEPVPTLQQLLDRLPEETRSRLTPSVPAPDVASSGPEPMALDALVERVVEQLFRRTDLMDELVRRLARSVDRDQAR